MRSDTVAADMTELSASDEVLDVLADRLADRLAARLARPPLETQKTFALVDARGLAAELGVSVDTCIPTGRGWGRCRWVMARRLG
jgi:hypothetical protein